MRGARSVPPSAMSRSFSYPARAHHRALTAAGEVERLARAALRGLRTGGLGRLGRLGRSWPHPAGLAMPAMDLDSTLGGSKPPILYLPAVAWQYRYQPPHPLAGALARAAPPRLYVDRLLRTPPSP